jgi:hypothetical protein
VRLVHLAVLSSSVVIAACVSTPAGGGLGEGSTAQPQIVSVDSGFPPRAVTARLTQDGYAALLLVAPGHSATLLYPPDSATNNRFSSGTHRIAFEVPTVLAETDSQRLQRIRDQQRAAPRSRTGTRRTVTPIPANAPTFLLLVTSTQPLQYSRMIDKTGGVSIPIVEMEALNAVAKAIKSTLPEEPRDWAGYYVPVTLRRTDRR